jgi:dolichol-phosphate mannosyltransferase
VSEPATNTVSTAAAVSIVIPTYNERGRLAEVVAAVFDVLGRHGIDGEIVVVDDNSQDGTGDLAEELATRYRMRVLHRAGKLGLGSAVIDGFRVASGAIVGVMDGDLSHPPALVPRMLALFTERQADFVIGSRYIPGGGTSDWSFGRLLLSRLACVLAHVVTPVRDASSGFFFVRKELAQGVRTEAGGFKICLELLVRGRAREVIEVPYVFAGRTVGESKMNLAEATGYLLQLGLLFKHRWSREGRIRRHYSRLAPA